MEGCSWAGTWATGQISYDGAGNIKAMGNDWFVADGLGRLTQAHLEDIDNDGFSDNVDLAYRYDVSGNRIAFNTYTPFGLQLTGQTTDRHHFTGHERDPGNLDCMHARYYSPVLGRFLSVDPISTVLLRDGDENARTRFHRLISQSTSWNRYCYALDNPLQFLDKSGKTVEVTTTGATWWFSSGGGAIAGQSIFVLCAFRTRGH